MNQHDQVRTRLLAFIAVLVAIAGLRASYPVTMPVAVAALVIAAIWPVKEWTDRILPTGLSYVGAVIAVLLIFAAFCLAIYVAAAQAVEAFVLNQQRFEATYQNLSLQLQEWGLPDPGGRQGYARLLGLGQAFLANAYTASVYIGFIAVLVMLGLPEVIPFWERAQGELDRFQQRDLAVSVARIAHKVRSYLAVSTLTSFITGFASAAWAYALGLELALVWGVLNFLLNYIPVVGNIVGIIPPSLFAFIQFDSWTMPLLVFAGLSVIQIVISNFIYPTLQGKSLSLSPVAILVALAFWSWIWGLAGALIAVPLTAALVIVCENFESTAWVASLLSGRRRGDGDRL